jgi:hypothetical protein
MTADVVSLHCDQGAHERCPGCACGCHHPDPSPRLGVGRGEVIAPGVGSVRHSAGAGSLIAWSHRDHRTLIQVLSAAIPGAFALGLLAWCVVLASQGLL